VDLVSISTVDSTLSNCFCSLSEFPAEDMSEELFYIAAPPEMLMTWPIPSISLASPGLQSRDLTIHPSTIFTSQECNNSGNIAWIA